ncbi:MAG TPA: hypothetical protein VIP11_14350 [Gemmatimonadaceae bacterium]
MGLFVCGAGEVACHKTSPGVVVAEPAPVVVTRPAGPPPITTGTMLIDAMHARYSGHWYRTLTFTQKTTISLASGGELNQSWHESIALPGKLRLDTDLAAKSGILYLGDSVFSFVNGKLVRADTGHNETFILANDVYARPPERTEAVLRDMGFDLSKLHHTRWEGREVYVVGALAGDTTSKQFWVERERLLFVRMIGRTPQGRSDFRLRQFMPAGGGWIAVEMEQYVNGKRRLRQESLEMRPDVTLPPSLFDPAAWAVTPTHWARKGKGD